MSEYPFFFTWAAQDSVQPLEIKGGHGARFETADGKSWLDLGSLSYQVNVGHGCTEIVDAICEQAKCLCLALPNAVYPSKTRLAEELLNIAPTGFNRVFFTLGGAEANENAIKIARLATSNYKIISRYRSYHGSTMGAITLTGDYRRAPVEPGLVGVVHVLDTECAQCADGLRSQDCEHMPLSQIPRVMNMEGGVAAVIVETIPGANGVIIPPKGYMKALRQACDENGALLICDEVLTGFGRTGSMFAFEHFDEVVPDMITLGKGITSGYAPLGAVLVHERVSQHFDEKTLYSGLTHYAHPLGVAAALANLRVLNKEKLVESSAKLEAVLHKGLDSLKKSLPTLVHGNRVKGLLSATELTLAPADFGKLAKALRGQQVHAHLRADHRALILAPPLCISQADLDEGLVKVEQALKEASL